MTDKPLPSNLELSFKILDAENHILYSGRGTIKWGTIIKNPKTQSVSRGCGIQFFEVSPVGKRLEFEAYLRDVYFKLNGKEYPKEKKEQQ